MFTKTKKYPEHKTTMELNYLIDKKCVHIINEFVKIIFFGLLNHVLCVNLMLIL
jgi:hypothetical protein